jgi:regulator of protease activity HflC (stomatin/prohibitin superfamily)
MVETKIAERKHPAAPGGLMLLFLLAAGAGIPLGAASTGAFEHNASPAVALAVVAVEIAIVVCLAGFFVVNPNEGLVLQLFGRYIGTAKSAGLRWANPFLSKRRISLRVRSFESERLKVNDIDGNPIEIAAIIVWKVVDTAQTCFHVDNYERFVAVQSESAVRNLASRYAYDAHDDDKPSLRGHTDTIADELLDEIQARLADAGVTVVEARISHLAYAPEIAQ